MKRVFLTLVCILMAVIASAEDGRVEIDGIWYYLNDYYYDENGNYSYGKSATVQCYSSEFDYADNGTYYTGDIVIPEVVNYNGDDYVVRQISEGAFQKCTEITSVKIPDSVDRIEYRAFCGCSSLKTISMSKNVKYIGGEAFLYCVNLRSIVLPEKLKTIESNAFEHCESLQEINLPSSLTSIGNAAFLGCSALKNVSIPENVTKIGGLAFKDCVNLESVEVKSNVLDVYKYISTSDWSWGVVYCHYLNGVGAIESNSCSQAYTIQSTGRYTHVYVPFDNCPKLSTITFAEGATIIPEGFCYNLYNLTLCNISKTVKTIGNRVFYNCNSLGSVEIPEGITTIEEYTFYGCSGLSELTIPSSVTTFKKDAFAGCYNELTSSVHIKDLSSWYDIDFENEYSNPLQLGAKLWFFRNLE